MQTTVVIHVAGAAADSVTFTPAVGVLRAPVAKGTVLGTLAILPSGWTGNVTVSGADVDVIGIDSKLNVIAMADMTSVRDYTVTINTVE